jgi:hypothetical protein
MRRLIFAIFYSTLLIFSACSSDVGGGGGGGSCELSFEGSFYFSEPIVKDHFSIPTSSCTNPTNWNVEREYTVSAPSYASYYNTVSKSEGFICNGTDDYICHKPGTYYLDVDFTHNVKTSTEPEEHLIKLYEMSRYEISFSPLPTGTVNYDELFLRYMGGESNMNNLLNTFIDSLGFYTFTEDLSKREEGKRFFSKSVAGGYTATLDSKTECYFGSCTLLITMRVDKD